MRHDTHRTTTLAFAAGLAVAIGASASAQDALGDGRALDGSLSTQGRHNVERPSLARELEFRNAVVTGNAPGGASFRGDVGYRAPREFRGDLGSDDLFAFRRDTLYSGLAGMGIRGTDAIQYQFSLTTGSRPPANLVGGLTVPRDGWGAWDTVPRGARPADQFTPEAPIRRIDPADPGADERGSMLWTLRSPGAYVSNRGFQPSLLATIEDPDDFNGPTYGLTASALRGVRLSTLAQTEQREPRPGAVPGLRADPERFTDARVPAERVRTAYDDVVERLETRVAELPEQPDDPHDPHDPHDPDTAESWRERMAEIQRSLFEADPQAEEEPDTDEAPVLPEFNLDDPRDDDEDREPDAALDRARERGAGRFDPETVRLLRESGGAVSSFIDPDSVEADVFAQHMRAGQRLLTSGRFFDAEERFTRALSMRPGEVTAGIGRIHAQIGAGMYLSAGVNLRGLFIEHPEILATRYDSELLPGERRLGNIFQILRENLGLAPAPGDLPPRTADDRLKAESALILAYLGFQTGNDETLTEALDAMKQLADTETTRVGATVLDGRLVELLRAVWLEGEDAPDRIDTQDGE